MRLPAPRGPVTRRVVQLLRSDRTDRGPHSQALALGAEPVTFDPDMQLALWMLYELSYRGFEDVPAEREWDPAVVSLRGALERPFEYELRAVTGRRTDEADQGDQERPVAERIEALIAADRAPSVAAYLRRHADVEQMRDYLRERSVQQLKESDPQSFVLPRLTGRAKVALAELQYDEYGAGRPEALHQDLYADALRGAGLRAEYGAYVTEVGAASLAAANALSMFGLHRRLRGAAMGHLATFEATSSAPSRKVAAGVERLGLPAEVARYFHEHVEADAVHEHVALRDICGSMVLDEPDLTEDVLFGAATCLYLEGEVGAELLGRWDQASYPAEAS